MICKQQVTIGGISVDIIRKNNLKNMYIRIFPPYGKVTVNSSSKFTEEDIQLFVLNKLPEITKIRDRMLSQLRQSKREYVLGESHYLWGKLYPLIVSFDGTTSKVEKISGKLILTVTEGADLTKRKKIFTEWYRQEMQRILNMQIEYCEQERGICANEYRIRLLAGRWNLFQE